MHPAARSASTQEGWTAAQAQYREEFQFRYRHPRKATYQGTAPSEAEALASIQGELDLPTDEAKTKFELVLLSAHLGRGDEVLNELAKLPEDEKTHATVCYLRGIADERTGRLVVDGGAYLCRSQLRAVAVGLWEACGKHASV